MRIFVTRMRLSGDAQAKEWLHLVSRKRRRRGKKNVSLSLSIFFSVSALFFSPLLLTSKNVPVQKKNKKKKKKKKKKKLNIQLLEAGLSVDTLQEG